MNNIAFLLTSFLIQLHCFTCVFLITDHFSENMTPSVTYCIVVRGRPSHSHSHRQHSQLLVKSEVFENVVSEIREQADRHGHARRDLPHPSRGRNNYSSSCSRVKEIKSLTLHVQHGNINVVILFGQQKIFTAKQSN